MLSESKIRWMWSEAHNDTSDRMAYQVLAEMVEAEVRKQDEALIRQMLDALELPGTKNHQMLLQCAAAERAARARLGEKT